MHHGYLEEIAGMDDEELQDECYLMIHQSSLCANNPRADSHWKVDACYDEATKRGGKIYRLAFKECYADHANVLP